MRTDKERRDIRERFADVDTSNVADVLDRLGCTEQVLAPAFARRAGEKLFGWAYTIQGEMRPYDGGGDPTKMEACAGVREGDVSVWAGGGEGVCYFGELIALSMAVRGSVGALVDGGVRDTAWLKDEGFPVFSTYHSAPIGGAVEGYGMAGTTGPSWRGFAFRARDTAGLHPRRLRWVRGSARGAHRNSSA